MQIWPDNSAACLLYAVFFVHFFFFWKGYALIGVDLIQQMCPVVGDRHA